MIRKTLSLLLAFLILSCCSEESQKRTIKNSPISIMTYYVPSAGHSPEQLPLEQLTHIIFSFSKVIDGEMDFDNKALGEELRELVAQKKNYPDLKVMIACGGWGADGFSDAANTKESRKKFILSCIRFIDRYQLDGLDIDWEYPGMRAAGTKARLEDKQNFTLLMKGLRAELDNLDRPQTLTFASAGWERYYENIELMAVMKYVDYMNVMTYDQAGGGNRFTAHHTALGLIEFNDVAPYPLGVRMKKRNESIEEEGAKWEPQSAERIIQYCMDMGVNPKQLVIGAAFYGRAWKGVQADQNGLYQSNKGPFGEGISYETIRQKYENKNGYTKYWDKKAKAPYLFNPSDSIFISYDDTSSVKLKAEYAIDKKLGGIMFWQLGGDTKNYDGLLNSIFEAATNN